jgi:hypothetical protein
MAMAGTAVGAAVIAGSAALLGSGLDSGIEAPACIIVIWRFTRTTFSARAPNPGSPSQGNPGLRKITRSLSPDLATFGWTGHHRNVRKDNSRTSFLRIGRPRREPTNRLRF